LTSSNYFAHESSFIDDQAEIGEGTKIWYFCHVLGKARIGKNCIIGQNVCVESGAIVGDGCKIQNNVSVYKGVVLEDEVFCGPSCVFTNVYNPRAFIERKHEFLSTLVKRGATIGANVTIVCGVTVGRYALIAAGSVVKRDVPDYGVIAGIPGRRGGGACKCGTTLKPRPSQVNGLWRQMTTCGYCGNEYEINGDTLRIINER
jgi:UDP-2-acetamido-3-amino-2,3-dideoxy-glucuronate N-acetyltransferase